MVTNSDDLQLSPEVSSTGSPEQGAGGPGAAQVLPGGPGAAQVLPPQLRGETLLYFFVLRMKS